MMVGLALLQTHTHMHGVSKLMEPRCMMEISFHRLLIAEIRLSTSGSY